ncbi:hypothetical protein GQ53DRAFT_236438 [Thozetella sp. PMI_491]|nr:hypothetical protein GQ53DRAFT_236438 [Thozetella sp. PMI_491]
MAVQRCPLGRGPGPQLRAAARRLGETRGLMQLRQCFRRFQVSRQESRAEKGLEVTSQESTTFRFHREIRQGHAAPRRQGHHRQALRVNKIETETGWGSIPRSGSNPPEAAFGGGLSWGAVLPRWLLNMGFWVTYKANGRINCGQAWHELCWALT